MPSNTNSDDFRIRVVDFVQHVFDTLTQNSSTQSWWNKLVTGCIVLIILLILIHFCVKGLVRLAEASIKAIGAYKNGKFRIIARADHRKLIRRRQQFCAVLDADLAYIAKAENWNDQYFTDLEAEVETEGGYYLSALDRLRKKRFYGKRRVSSLIGAIDTSSERAVLLVGEPGSGKSVALRHLAKQLAERGKRSKNKNIPIPLYLNLRELEVGENEEVNADLIKQFVFDNIRRGDADTSSYVSDNWVENKESGAWFFLFDSFDEIPAVLHAATDSQAVKIYSDAIRRFLDAQGECRSVLASREYKGPQALPWKKFRILQLNEDKQGQLVDNSFLPIEKINLIKHYLAADKSKLGNSPLFLTLLCRHFKELNNPPANDHQLLSSHIIRLAAREPEYIEKKYKLCTEQIISGAQMLAVAFAENPELSLAPKIDEIAKALGARKISSDDLQNLISALVDVKIGRNDVAVARQGDRRFAFAHRRYQETLFAEYLASNPSHINPTDLLTLPQWREYAVTLLQSQSASTIRPIIDAAIDIINIETQNQKIFIPPYLEQESVGYFEWQYLKSTVILKTLQEGLAKRREDIPLELSDAIFKILSPRWNDGDRIDRYMVVKLGGLLPADVLTVYLGWTLRDSIDEFSELALRQCIFLEETNDYLNNLICKKIANEALAANSNILRLRLNALAAQLPNSIGISLVLTRCRRLRPVLAALCTLGLIALFPNWIISAILKKFNIKNEFTETLDRSLPSKNYAGGTEWMGVFVFFPLITIASVLDRVFSSTEKADGLPTMTLSLSLYFLLSSFFLFLILSIFYSHRATPHKIKIMKLISWKEIRPTKKLWLLISAGLGSLAVIVAIPWFMGNLIYQLLKIFIPNLVIAYPSRDIGLPVFGVMMLFVGFSIIISRIRNRKIKTVKFHAAKKSFGNDYEIFLSAEDFSEAAEWLSVSPEFLSKNVNEARSAAAVVFGVKRIPSTNYNSNWPLLKCSIKPSVRLRTLIWRRTFPLFMSSCQQK